MMMLVPNSFRKRGQYPIKRKTIQKEVSITQKPNQPAIPHSTDCNVSFQYMYRDASNYKQHGEAVLTNWTFMPIEEIEKQIRCFLKDGEYFIAQQVNIEERFFDALYEDDHPWHEFKRGEFTTKPAFDPANWRQHKHKRGIKEFIADLEKAHRSGWDERQVRPDVARLMARQKDELKRTFEAGKDILS